MTELFRKLNLKSEPEIVVLNAPESFELELARLEGVSVVRQASKVRTIDFALAFAITQAQLDKASTALTKRAPGDVTLWIAYPKQSSKRYQCDFNRDTGWSVLGQAGFEPVRSVAIDEDWTALRFRRVEHIKTLTRDASWALSAAGKVKATQPSASPDRRKPGKAK
ncbi:MAG: hypothetical protein IPK72_18460 [Candidatus Eisenbacteria bacterium]|nr:hypothetical protein [Candidatus Eisenbacteria bacterium]